ncbi:MAG: amino acid ABC transporter permease [candidate division NC10 bacterium]|nr:amino acid ABC transporter permease [candidate division NC10 bacterium]MBI2457447.1 amino acid ABC transporter permease [candidate division NC10 bacterium]MBI2919347.1 amino acid ABC transporter permease [Chloroflexota bacterium]MBI3085855.1 amino acid ABC transporter permease [candidate division NC10 bacterium]
MLQRILWNNRGEFLEGLLVTAEISLIAIAVAMAVGLVICLVRMYCRPLRWLALLYIEFCRSTPIYVQLMWVNYVWPELFGWPQSFFAAGWAALALQSSGYLAETFRSGIEGVARGQREAALSTGLSPFLTMRWVILPQAVLMMTPSLMNQFLVVVKSSCLVSVIAVPDLMYRALRLTSIWFEPIEILSFTAFLYVAIVFALSAAIKWYSDRLRSRYA